MRKTLGSSVHKRLVGVLVQRRAALGLTQEEVARRLEVRQQIVTSIEQGQRRIDIAEFFQIADALEFDPESVLGDLRRLHKPIYKGA